MSSPAAPSAVTLVVGNEDLLVDRAVRGVEAAARKAGDVEVHEVAAADLRRGDLAALTAPSLFGGAVVVVVQSVERLVQDDESVADAVTELTGYVGRPDPEATVVLVHNGSSGGRGVLNAARKAGAAEIKAQAPARAGMRAHREQFVVDELRAAGRTATREAVDALVDAVGTDLRDLAGACSQLAHDTEGVIDDDVVGRYYAGRAEVTSFAVAEHAVAGRTLEAVESLRYALASGVVPVLVTSAVARSLRQLGRLGSAPGGLSPAQLATEVGVPEWKLRDLRGQLRSWSESGVATALKSVAAADAAVKTGEGATDYVLERMVVTVARCRGR